MSLEIRPLRPGEEAAWVAIGTPAADVAERLKAFFGRLERYPEDPRCLVVAVRDGQLVGKLRGTVEHADLYLVDHVRTTDPADMESVGVALVRWVRANVPGRIEAVCWDKPEQAAYRECLEASGFELFMSKAFVKRGLEGYRSPYPDPFTYRSLAQTGREAFVDALARVSEASLSRDMHIADPASDLAESVEMAGTAFEAGDWKLARLDGQLAGLILPQRYPDLPTQGTLLQIGIVPAQRGKGLGKILHAAGLQILAERGAREYVGSTAIENAPMRRVFELNGCRTVGKRLIFRTGSHWP